MDNNVSFQLMEIRTTFTACHDASRECKSKIKEGEVYNNTFLESLRPEKLFALFSKDNRSTRIELYRVSKNMFPQCFIRLKKKYIQKKELGNLNKDLPAQGKHAPQREEQDKLPCFQQNEGNVDYTEPKAEPTTKQAPKEPHQSLFLRLRESFVTVGSVMKWIGGQKRGVKCVIQECG